MSLTSQKAAILWHLRRGKGLTALEALRMFQCFRLAARVYELRADGHDIAKVWREVGHKRVAWYWLAPDSKKPR